MRMMAGMSAEEFEDYPLLQHSLSIQAENYRALSPISPLVSCVCITVSGKHLTFSEAYIIIHYTTQFTICSIFVNRRIRTNTIREQSNKEHSKPTLRLHIRIFAASSDDNICILVYCMLPPEFRIEFL